MALCAAALALPAAGAQFGDVQLGGSVIDEWSYCDNCAAHVANPNPFDPRGVLGTTPAVNQPGNPASDQNNLFLLILNGGVRHEFDNAVTLEGYLSTRQRNYHADIAGEQFVEKTGEVRDVRMPVEQVRDLVERRLAPGCLHVKRDPGGIEEGGELAGHAKG